MADGDFVSSNEGASGSSSNDISACSTGGEGFASIYNEDNEIDVDNVAQYDAYKIYLSRDKDEDNCMHGCTCMVCGPETGHQCVPHQKPKYCNFLQRSCNMDFTLSKIDDCYFNRNIRIDISQEEVNQAIPMWCTMKGNMVMVVVLTKKKMEMEMIYFFE